MPKPTALAIVLLLAALTFPLGCRLKPRPATINADWNWDKKLSKLNVETATLQDVIRVFGEPQKYVWGQNVFDKKTLPVTFIALYPNKFQVVFRSGRIMELRHESKDGFLFEGKIGVGSTLDDVIKVLGKPKQTVVGQEIGFVDSILYKDINGKLGYCYYSSRDKHVRMFFAGYVVTALYTNTNEFPNSPCKPVSDSTIKANLPNEVQVDLIGVVYLDKNGIESWSPQGRPMENPGVLESDLEQMGYCIAFRCKPNNGSFKTNFIVGSKITQANDCFYIKKSNLWLTPHTGDPHTGDRRFCNLYIDQICGGPIDTYFEIACDQNGINSNNFRGISKNGITGISDLVPLGPDRFRLTIEFQQNIVGSVFMAVDKSGKAYAPGNGSFFSSRRDDLTFDFDPSQLAAIRRVGGQTSAVLFRNISLRPGQFTTVEVEVEGQKNSQPATRNPQQSSSPLHFAAQAGHKQLAQSLIDNGAEINAPDPNGNTPLHLAAANGHQEMCIFLLDRGANPNAKNNAGQTPLDLATLHGHQSTANTIMEKTRNPQQPPSHGCGDRE